jgi:glutamate/tyrosine decarboxylase-like PLP-dependent enzyme
MIQSPIERHPFAKASTLDYANMRPPEPSIFEALGAAAAYLRYATVNLINTRLEGVQALHDKLSGFIAKEVLKVSDGFQAVIETSGSHSNLKALELARDKTQRGGIIVSSLSHNSIQGAAHTLGLDLRTICVDHVSLQLSAEDIMKELRKGDVAALVLTGGTTEQGLVEKLYPQVEEYCLANGIWIHIDAAFGGFNIGLVPKGCSKDM